MTRSVELGKLGFICGPRGARTRAAVYERTGDAHMPQLFIGGKAMGGLFDGGPGGGGLNQLVEGGTLRQRSTPTHPPTLESHLRETGGGSWKPVVAPGRLYTERAHITYHIIYRTHDRLHILNWH